jgi:hypothetical protein
VLCQVGSYFQLTARGSTFSTEIRAGIVTFLTVSGQHGKRDVLDFRRSGFGGAEALARLMPHAEYTGHII